MWQKCKVGGTWVHVYIEDRPHAAMFWAASRQISVLFTTQRHCVHPTMSDRKRQMKVKKRSPLHRSRSNGSTGFCLLHYAKVNINFVVQDCHNVPKLKEAHLKYCILRMYQQCPKHFPMWSTALTLKHTFDTNFLPSFLSITWRYT